jgi:hypothetical protein
MEEHNNKINEIKKNKYQEEFFKTIKNRTKYKN